MGDEKLMRERGIERSRRIVFHFFNDTTDNHYSATKTPLCIVNRLRGGRYDERKTNHIILSGHLLNYCWKIADDLRHLK